VRDWIRKFGYEIDRSIGFRIVKKEDVTEE